MTTVPLAPFAIEARGLEKRFQNGVVAVKGLDLLISPGESVAFLGPNGAGKSTTIKMLCGILRPDKGSVKVKGHAAGTSLANRNLGIVFGARSQLFFHMSVEQSLLLQAETYFVPPKDQVARMNKLAVQFEAKDLLKMRVRELSLGQRMRCELIASLIHQPEIILLDEPTIGLDLQAKHHLRERLREWQKQFGTTILLTSHDISDVEVLCDRCVLVQAGEKAYDGPLSQVKGDLKDVRRVKLLLSRARSNFEAEQARVVTHFAGKMKLSDQVLGEFELQYEFNLKEVALSDVLSTIASYFGESLEDVHLAGVSLEEVIRAQMVVK